MQKRLSSIFGQPVRIYVLSADPSLMAGLNKLFPQEEVEWQGFTSGKALMEAIFTSPPHMLISAPAEDDLDSIEVVRMIKSENVFRQVCAVLCLTPELLAKGMDWDSVEADDFILLPLEEERGLAHRLELALRRSTRTLDANPLTRLPGNTSIMQIVEQFLREEKKFALAYLDIDHFKSFNDKYGFSRGDEALLMTARLLVSIIMGVDETPKFVGHIGGDDFVFILPRSSIEEACKKIVSAFDSIVPSFYDDEDRERGSILSTDRQGVIHSYPLMSVSIAVAVNNRTRFRHYGEITQVLGQLKTVAKSKVGSNYVIDRRRN